jgi:ADP-ribose pyrophosphatase
MSQNPEETSPVPPERVVASQELYRGRILALRVDRVELPDGRVTTREIVEHPGAVVIVAPDGQGRVAMVRQYRAAVGRRLLELPAGTREPAESAQACAARELTEEMGLRADQWSELTAFYSAPGFCTEQLVTFVATGLSPASAPADADEAIQREWIELAAVPGMIARGEICDAKSIAGLLLYLNQDRGDPWHV